MSFYDIKDKDERDRTIEEYLATMKRIKKRNMDERISDLRREADMQEMFKPVLESNAEMANEITQDLVPIKQELETLNETIRNRDRLNRMQIMGSPRRLPQIPATPPTSPRPISRILQDLAATPLAKRPIPKPRPVRYGKTAAEYLMKALNEGNKSVTGIRYVDSDMMIGDKKVEVQDNNLKIGDEIYDGTPGLWALITEKKPKDYTAQDLDAYGNLMMQTNALYQNNDPATERSRANGGNKWRKIQKPIWNRMTTAQGNGIVTDLLKRYQTNPRRVRGKLITELVNLLV